MELIHSATIFKKNHELSDKFFENINEINLKTLNFKIWNGIIGKFDYIRIMKNIKNGVNLYFWKCSDYDTWVLEFKNVPILIKSNRQESIFVKWKSFIWIVSINKISNDFCFSKRETGAIHNDRRFLYIINSDECNFENWEKVSDKEVKILNDEFSSDSIISNNDHEFIIPMRCLNYVDISNEQISKIMEHDDKIIFIKELCEAPKFNCSLNFSTDLNYLNQYADLFPLKCSYLFWEYSTLNYEDKSTKSVKTSIIESLSIIHISCIYIWRLLTEEEYMLLKAILSSSNIKLYLFSIKVILNHLNDALDILELLSECKNLESVALNYASLEGI